LWLLPTFHPPAIQLMQLSSNLCLCLLRLRLLVQGAHLLLLCADGLLLLLLLRVARLLLLCATL